MKFSQLCSATAALCLVLSLTLMVAPEVIFWLFGLAPAPSAAVMARRAALLFLGLAVILHGQRNVPEGSARLALARGIAISMAALALLGLVEFAAGNVGMGIALAVVVEATIATQFTKFARS